MSWSTGSGAQPEGYVLLSFSKASRLRIWDTLERAMREQLLVSGRVTERTKGGLMVDVGVPAFMPGSQVDVRPIHDLDQFRRPGYSGQGSEDQPAARQRGGFAQDWRSKKN